MHESPNGLSEELKSNIRQGYHNDDWFAQPSNIADIKFEA